VTYLIFFTAWKDDHPWGLLMRMISPLARAFGLRFSKVDLLDYEFERLGIGGSKTPIAFYEF